MNAVICLRSLPFTIFGGVFAITTSTPALIKLVHQSFSPLRMKAEPSSRRVGAQTHVRRIGAGVRFGEGESGNFLARDPRQIFLLLLFRAEKQQRLRHADRLMRGNERGQVRIPTAEQHRGAAVIHLRQARARHIRFGILTANAPIAKSSSMFFCGISPVRSISSASTLASQIFAQFVRGTARLRRGLPRSAPGRERCGRNRSGR